MLYFKGTQQSAEAYGAFGNLKVDMDRSFKCKAKEDFSLDKGVLLKLSDLQYRAFGKTGSSDFTKYGGYNVSKFETCRPFKKKLKYYPNLETVLISYFLRTGEMKTFTYYKMFV